MDNFQFDYCLNDSYKVIISPTYQMIPSNENEINKLLEKYSAEFIPLISANVTSKTVKISFLLLRNSDYGGIEYEYEKRN